MLFVGCLVAAAAVFAVAAVGNGVAVAAVYVIGCSCNRCVCSLLSLVVAVLLFVVVAAVVYVVTVC